MALPLFACTLFVSAFFLFLVQPIIGKIILPKLGGTPQVWNTCMVFFQTALLAGYAYTHTVSSRLIQRHQLILHGILLFVPFLVLAPFLIYLLWGWDNPFFIQGWTPNLGANPIPDTLLWLATRVGIPFIVVATSAPLLQKWFASTGHPAAKDPYFLYGASNLGSLLSLLLYPVAVEPWLGLADQAWLFTAGYTLLIMLVLACAAMVWAPSGKELRHADVAPDSLPSANPPPVAATGQSASGITATPPAPANPAVTGVKKGPPRPIAKHGGKVGAEPVTLHRADDELTPLRRLRWIGLAAVPTSFMLGVTTHITTDLSPIPLFWLVPLTLYLLSFILVYSRWPLPWVDAPHKYVLVAQPVALALMVFVEILGLSSSQIWVAVFFDVLAFFLTALACHGELAKDRPSTRYLTEYYLWMSVGGMLGGMFNGLFAPILFIRVIEFNIAVFVACLLRPLMVEEGWTDKAVASMLDQPPKHPHAKGHKAPAEEAATTYGPLLDFVLPACVLGLLGMLVYVLGDTVAWFAEKVTTGSAEARHGMRLFLTYGIPLAIACFYFGRPVRFGLAIGAVLLIHSMYMSRQDRSIFADRSYFGIIRVKEESQNISIGKDNVTGKDILHPFRYNTLIHGHINHGMNFLLPTKAEERGKPDMDYSRLATTYYHRFGPAGIVMEKFNWSPGKQNTYHADARMPASLLAAIGGDLSGSVPLPSATLVDLWSEPPFATIGLGTGTMASYARPYQHCHYYEIDDHIKLLSLPKGDDTRYFNYLDQAQKRGAEVQVLMGDARLRMALPYVNHHNKDERGRLIQGGGPNNFYHMMVVDAFSSDAIPVHLITKEALELYFQKLTEEGVLCVHTSNRFVNLPKVVAAVASSIKTKYDAKGKRIDKDDKTGREVAQELPLAYTRGHDNAPFDHVGHFTSEWIMVARKQAYLNDLKTPAGYAQAMERNEKFRNMRHEEYWTTPEARPRYIWTDDHSNLISVLRSLE